MTFHECIVDKQMISLQVDVRDACDGIYSAVKPLIQTKCCTVEYGKAIVESYSKLGSYFVLTDGFAIPHTRPEFGALEVGFSLLTFKNPVVFNSIFDPIKVLLAFCTPNNDAHMEGIEMICSLLEKENIIDKLWNAKSNAEIIQLIS